MREEADGGQMGAASWIGRSGRHVHADVWDSKVDLHILGRRVGHLERVVMWLCVLGVAGCAWPAFGEIAAWPTAAALVGLSRAIYLHRRFVKWLEESGDDDSRNDG